MFRQKSCLLNENKASNELIEVFSAQQSSRRNPKYKSYKSFSLNNFKHYIVLSLIIALHPLTQTCIK